jgi:NAD(P)-dependent dehydrogenase (short-subunit alcohol dehydrogenase family)
MGKLDNRVALVTGASRGIGRAIARALAGQGAAVVLSARSEAALDDAATRMSDLGGEVVTKVADVAEPAQVDALFTWTMEHYGKLDVLVNNAGAFDGGPIDELSVEAWDRVMATNLRGPFLCTQAAMRIMKRQQQGRIINIGSISARRVRPNSAPYSTSKHGLWGLTQVTALEGREHGITCCCLQPGNVFVERRNTESPEDAEPMMSVESIAEVALLMATLPPEVEMLEAIVLPHQQLYVGRG